MDTERIRIISDYPKLGYTTEPIKYTLSLVLCVSTRQLIRFMSTLLQVDPGMPSWSGSLMDPFYCIVQGQAWYILSPIPAFTGIIAMERVHINEGGINALCIR